MITDIFAEVKIPESLQLDIAGLPKGIDNYHVDVRLSSKFCSDTQKFIAELLHREASLNPDPPNHEIFSTTIQKSYLDMMTVLIHRVKTDLNPADINFLQFAIPSFVLQSVKNNLDKYINNKKKISTKLRADGSGKVLDTHEHIVWLRKNYNSILYAINKNIFKKLYHVEKNQLRPIRKQYLNSSAFDFTDLIFNPMLLTSDINSPRFLIEQYLFWVNSAEESEFNQLNKELEELFKKLFPDLEILSLKTEANDQSETTEIYDILGGLFLTKKFLGPAVDSKNMIHEEFCWLDSPDNIQYLFNIKKLKESSSAMLKEHGFIAWWQYHAQMRRLKKTLLKASRIIRGKNLLKQFVASCKTRKLLSNEFSTQVEPKILCQYLSGQISEKKIQDKIFGGKTFTEDEIDSLQLSAKEVVEESKTQLQEYITKILLNLTRYRLHLKYFRFTHRIFNRMNVLSEEEDIFLSKQAGTLFELSGADKVEDDRDKIVHHTILKADVHGSTTVTAELENKGLNPASYFSTCFISPINKVLSVFGANKVFVEGDSIILSFLEYQHSPQQWFGLAHSCGLAKTILAIIHANNARSKQMGLPPMELGIGISYSSDSPRFFFDGDKPIMISSAIGQAGKMSSCSWKLRQSINPGLFNVEMLEIAEGEREYVKDGRELQYIHYNVNGILLENEAFKKLQTEVDLRRITPEVDGKAVVLYYGEYPDMDGKKRNLVIRQGTIGLWQNGSVKTNESVDNFYYEVVTNSKIISLVQTTKIRRPVEILYNAQM